MLSCSSKLILFKFNISEPW